ncbi:hypothetical protein BJ742DRAFT_834085 [Cladochytrium replicatum]|nr:hypothetical protein BJ742DRAFT_834085 [Cladochytrium replicatum]
MEGVESTFASPTVNLWCMLNNAPQMFGVEVPLNADFHNLKKRIKAENPQLPNNLPAQQLLLVKVTSANGSPVTKSTLVSARKQILTAINEFKGEDIEDGRFKPVDTSTFKSRVISPNSTVANCNFKNPPAASPENLLNDEDFVPQQYIHLLAILPQEPSPVTFQKFQFTESTATFRKIPLTRNMEAYEQALRHGELRSANLIESPEAKYLDLGDAHLFGDSSKPRKVLVRQSYEDLYRWITYRSNHEKIASKTTDDHIGPSMTDNYFDSAEDLTTSATIDNTITSQTAVNNLREAWIICGTAGTGKSTFGAYLLHQIFMSSSHKFDYIIWHTADAAYYFNVNDKSGSCAIHIEEFLEYVLCEQKEEVSENVKHKITEAGLYICDGVPFYSAVKQLPSMSIVVLSSNQRKDWKELKKHSYTAVVYMPVWSVAEMLTLHKIVFAELDVSLVFDAIWACGGVPRHVFDKNWKPSLSFEFFINELNTTIDRVDWKTVVNAVAKAAVPDEKVNSSDKVLHINVFPGSYNQPFMQFSSDYVAQRIVHRLLEAHRMDAKLFSNAFRGIGEYAAAQGYIIENMMHEYIPLLGEFHIRNLSSGETSVGPLILAQKPMETHCFSMLNIKPNVYNRPKSKNFTSVDAVVLPNLLFQFTVSSDHGVKVKGLKSLMDTGLLSNSSLVYLFFVVPADQFDLFRLQPWINVDGTTTKNLPQWLGQIHQVVATPIKL